MEPFIGQICLFPYNFAPRGWAFCNGQILSISQYTALFSLLGTTYGGNGQTTFALPDLRGRVPVSSGQGPGLSNYDLGQVGGSEGVTLNVNQLPSHNHMLMGSGNAATVNSLNGNVLASSNGTTGDEQAVGVNTYTTAGSPATADPSSISQTGGNQPAPIVQPYLAMNYCIALEGIFPSRN